jgi:lysophospholipase L1-like esterase
MRLLVFAALWATVVAVAAPSVPIGPRENVVILGDSITADGRYAQMVQDFLDTRYPERHIHVIATGASGDTVPRALARLDADVTPWHPSWVLINLGINDLGQYTPAEYLYHYDSLLDRITRDTGARIGIMSFIYPDRDGGDRTKEEAFVAGLQALAKKHDALYIPCYETFRRLRPTLPRDVRYAPDGVHPVQLGYWIFAETILQAWKYPFNKAPITLTMPVTRLASVDNPNAEKLIGTTFTVGVPQPLRITVTPYIPPQATAVRAKTPVIVDGKLTEWALLHPIPLAMPAQRSGGVRALTAPARNTRAYAAYDDHGLYFAFVVDTPYLYNKPTSTSIMRDSIELHLDLRAPNERAAAKSTSLFTAKHAAQLLLYPASADVPKAGVEKGSGDAALLEGVQIASTPTKTGYQLECCIPKAQFPANGLVAGARYGLDITIDDLDRFERWCDLVQDRWTGSQYSFFSVLEFGVLNLE